MKKEYKIYNQLKEEYLSRINLLERELLETSDEVLLKRARGLRDQVKSQLTDRYRKLKDKNQDLLLVSEDIFNHVLPSAFALVREVSRRLLGMRHYDEQIIGGIALHKGNIAELKNGEGKTIVALLPAYLNALFIQIEYEIKSKEKPNFKKRSVHIVTTNDYLARRDYVWLRPVYEFLGVTVSYLQEINTSKPSYNMGLLERKTMYTADIIYGATHEFIFDFLRDNRQSNKSFQVQGEKYLVVIDEVDHALLDEARTPHRLSESKPGFSKQDLGLIYIINNLAREIYQDQRVLTLINMNTLVPTRTGANIIRLFGKQLISNKSSHNLLAKHFSGEEIIGLVFGLIYHATKLRRQQVGSELFKEIQKIFDKSSASFGYYETDANGNVIGLGKKTKEKLLEVFLDYQEDGQETLDYKDFVSLLNLVARNLPAFNEIILSSGLTSQDLRRILSQSDAINLMQKIISDPDTASRQIALLIIDILELFVREIIDISLKDINRLRMFIREITVFLGALLPQWGNGNIHQDYARALKKIGDIYLFGLNKSQNALAPEAFLNLASSIVFPIISNLFAPQKPLQTHNKLVIVTILLTKTLIAASQIEQPKNKLEQQLYEFFKTLQKVYTNNLFLVDAISERIYLTYWCELIIEEYAKQIGDFRLWEKDESSLRKIEVQDLKFRISFLLQQALKSYAFHELNNQYIIRESDNKTYDDFTGRKIDKDIVIIGELTGRIMPGRRWQQWIHSFLEAKENIPVRRESRSIASISAQAYFKMYPKISGMTGTAHIGVQSNTFGLFTRMTQGFLKLFNKNRKVDLVPLGTDPLLPEFKKTYDMDVIVVPEHRPKQREDLLDMLYISKKGKLSAIINKIVDVHKTGQPILVETVSIAQSIEIANLLASYAKHHNINLPYNILNALNDEQEAEIITQAGLPGAITISTQLAGRGTDIIVSEESIKLGGLYVLGVERRWSRRWDNQIAGRAGRQGEPGKSQFFLSYDDEILIQVKNQSFALLSKMGLDKELQEADHLGIQNKMLTSVFYNQQVHFEYHSGISRSQTEDFDKVLGKYRNFILHLREKSFDENYTCPACLNPEQLISLDSEDLVCSNCATISTANENRGLWRPYFGKLLASTVHSMLSKDNLESDLVGRYASSVFPGEWEWDNLIEEVKKLVRKHPTKKLLTKGINFKNALNYQEEVLTLKRNLHHMFEEDRRLSILDAANEIISMFEKQEHDLRNWDFQKLFREINAALGLDIPINVYTKINILEGRSKIKSEITSIIDEAFRFSLLGQKSSSMPKDQVALQVISSFAPYSNENLSLPLLRKAFDDNKIEEFFTQTLANFYNSLVKKHAKSQLYKLENEIFREEIDELWCQFLFESQLRINEIRGDTPRDRLADYEYQLAEVFELGYADACMRFIRRVFDSDKELEKRRAAQSAKNANSYFISAHDFCGCHSGKGFMDCCGRRLFTSLDM